MLEHQVQQHFIDSADLKYQAAQLLGAPIGAAVQALLACVTNGAKVLAWGAGPAHALAQQFAQFCIDGFERERPALAALALARGADADAARQVHALGQAGDLLLVLADAAHEGALLAPVQAAHERDMTVVALLGRDGGALAAALQETDVRICVPHDRAARVREVHALVLHCLCDGMDTQLLGEQEIAG